MTSLRRHLGLPAAPSCRDKRRRVGPLVSSGEEAFSDGGWSLLTEAVVDSTRFLQEPHTERRTVGWALEMFFCGRLEFPRGLVRSGGGWLPDLVRVLLQTPAPASVDLREADGGSGREPRYEVVSGSRTLAAAVLFASGAVGVPLSGETVCARPLWAGVFGGGPGMLSDEYTDRWSVPVSDGMLRFRSACAPVLAAWPAAAASRSAAADNFRSRGIAVRFWPRSWSAPAVGLFSGYAGCERRAGRLLHGLMDPASISLRDLEPDSHRSHELLGVDGSGCLAFRSVLNAFAIAGGAPSVPPVGHGCSARLALWISERNPEGTAELVGLLWSAVRSVSSALSSASRDCKFMARLGAGQDALSVLFYCAYFLGRMDGKTACFVLLFVTRDPAERLELMEPFGGRERAGGYDEGWSALDLGRMAREAAGAAALYAGVSRGPAARGL